MRDYCTEGVLLLQIAFLDLDLKHLKKIPFYHALDKEIGTTYKTNTRLDS